MSAVPKPNYTPQAEQNTTISEEERKRREDAIALLQSWQDADEEDTQDQRETYQYLVKALNADLLPGQRRRI